VVADKRVRNIRGCERSGGDFAQNDPPWWNDEGLW
jgi:hypothetical protein